jgi:hypothetical protein
VTRIGFGPYGCTLVPKWRFEGYSGLAPSRYRKKALFRVQRLLEWWEPF